MSQFEYIMDDMKSSLKLSFENKQLFYPAIAANIAYIVIAISLMVLIFISIFSVAFTAAASTSDSAATNILGMSALIIVLTVIGVILTSLAFLIIEVGSIQLIIDVLDGKPVTRASFIEGVKTYVVKIFFTNIALSLIYILGFVILLAPLILYTVTVGVLTFGYGMLLLTLVFQSLLGYWVLILMNDGGGCFESIGKNIRFGRAHLKPMLFIFFVYNLFAANFVYQSGLSATGLIVVLVTYSVGIYFRMVLIKTYRRLNKSL